jgi:hypothetical protein
LYLTSRRIQGSEDVFEFKRIFFTSVMLLIVTNSQSFSQSSPWQAWSALGTSWAGSDFNLKCGDDVYRIGRSLIGNYSLSLLGADGNWEKIETAKFSDTSVVYSSRRYFNRKYLYLDVVRSKPVQGITSSLRTKLEKVLAQENAATEFTLKKKLRSEIKDLATCRDRNERKFTTSVSEEYIASEGSVENERKVKDRVQLEVHSACLENDYKVREIELNIAALELNIPEPEYEVSIEGSDWDSLTLLDFQSGQSRFRIQNWVQYSINLKVGRFSDRRVKSVPMNLVASLGTSAQVPHCFNYVICAASGFNFNPSAFITFKIALKLGLPSFDSVRYSPSRVRPVAAAISVMPLALAIWPSAVAIKAASSPASSKHASR